jgi:hypothetical protein
VATLRRGYLTALVRRALPLPGRAARHGWWEEVAAWLHEVDAQLAAQGEEEQAA